jgi:hypothetical protein
MLPTVTAADDRRRGAAVYGRDPDAELVAALVAAAPSSTPAPEAGEEASRAQVPTGGARSRRQALAATLVIAATVVAVGVAVQVGTLGRHAAPPFEPVPTATAISDELTRTRTVPVTIDGGPADCRVVIEFTLRDPSPRGVAQLGRFETFVRHHRWAVPPTSSIAAGEGDLGPTGTAARAMPVMEAVGQGLKEFEARRADAHWSDSLLMTTSTACD